MMAKKYAIRTNGEMRATPRQPFLGSLADIAKAIRDQANKVYFKEEVPLLGGEGMGSLMLGEAPEELERWSYGNLPFQTDFSRLPVLKTGRASPLIDTAFAIGPMAAPAARAVKAVPEALKMAGEDLLKAGVASAPHVVKPRGGQWIGEISSTSPESISDSLKLKTAGNADPAEALAALQRTYDPSFLSSESDAFFRRSMADMEAKKSMNDWLGSTLTKYIKRDLGTPEDPVRELAEKGVLHYNPENLSSRNYGIIEENRIGQYGKSELAKKWEDVSDLSIESNTAGGLAEIEGISDIYKMPWLSKIPPETLVYETPNKSISIDNLGLAHLRDEMMNAVSPESSLPESLRLRPESLSRMSMPQAVEHVSKINKWREAQMTKARKSIAEGIPVHKEYEEGFKWLAPSDLEKDKNAMKYITDIGCEGGWCTQGESMALMYGGKENRLFVLSDKSGKPVVQVSVTNKEGQLPEITEIQGKRNQPPSEEHMKYVQDFIKSKKWGYVDSPERVGLLEIGGEYLTEPELKSTVSKALKAVSSKRPSNGSLAGQQNQILGVLNDFENAEPDEIGNALEAAREYIGKESGFAKGGAVNLVEKYGAKKSVRASQKRALDKKLLHSCECMIGK